MASCPGVEYGRLSLLRKMLRKNQYWRSSQVVERMMDGDCVIEDEDGDHPYSSAKVLVPLFYRELQKDKEGLLYSLGEYVKSLLANADDPHVRELSRGVLANDKVSASALRDWLLEQHGECVETEELLFIVEGEWELR